MVAIRASTIAEHITADTERELGLDDAVREVVGRERLATVGDVVCDINPPNTGAIDLPNAGPGRSRFPVHATL